MQRFSRKAAISFSLYAPETKALNAVVRHATAADIPAMMAVEKDAPTAAHWSRERYEQIFMTAGPGLLGTTGGTPSAQPAERRLYKRGRQLSRLALVVEEGASVHGFLVARCVDNDWEIENIVVASPARGRGLGTRLLGEFLDLARHQGAEAVFLEVRESNQAARSLYQKWAFVEIGRRKHYYKDPQEDAVVYRLGFV